MTCPLDGLRVLEYTGALGQYAGKLLADMGADVVKVEPPHGSEARGIGPFVDDEPGLNRSLNFWYHNTNKRSVIADLMTEAGLERWRGLVSKADIVIEDAAPGMLTELGAGYEALLASHPDLIWCSITPFGQDGPWAHYQATDLIGLAVGVVGKSQMWIGMIGGAVGGALGGALLEGVHNWLKDPLTG